jgi:hypothetical protein
MRRATRGTSASWQLGCRTGHCPASAQGIVELKAHSPVPENLPEDLQPTQQLQAPLTATARP